jgi:cobalt-zinc-cadmium efflux system outer membrane protein
MKSARVAALGAALAVSPAWPARGADGLTLEAALSLARAGSPDVLAARRRVAEAAARLRARPGLRENPALEGAWGARDAGPSDFEVGLSQTFELGGRGGSRRDVDRAALAREEAEFARAERAVLREVRVAFRRGLLAAERLRLAAAVEVDAAEMERIARRRHEQGDVAALDLNVAASARSRARAELKAAEAASVSALTDLRLLLGLAGGEPLSLAGPLWEEAPYDPASLLAAAAGRPEVQALQAQRHEAEAEARLGRGLAWPDVTPAVRYERDEGDHVLWAGVTVTLPLFDRGQQLGAVARARRDGLLLETEARTRALQGQVQGALALHELRLAAVAELAANAATLADSEALARRSYEVGQIGLGELLLVRRETAEARRLWLDSLLELAQARAELDAMSGGAR